MIRLIALDIDGTILDSQGTVSADTLQAIAEARAKGVLVTLITGRTRRSARHPLRDFKIDLPYIGANGAFAAIPGREAPLFCRSLILNDVEAICETALQHGIIGFAFHFLDHSYYDQEAYRWMQEYAPSWVENAEASNLHDMIHEMSTPLKIEILGEEERIQAVHDCLIRSRGHLLYALGADAHMLEINDPEANKGNGLRYLSNYFGIPLSEIAACGDALADVSMLKMAGYSIAMGNACPEVKAQACAIAPSNDEAGAAWAIRKMLAL